MSVLLPYDAIRRNFSRLSWRLEAVITPRLVILDASSHENVIIRTKLHDRSLSPEESVSMTGLRDWSQGLFGDPLVSSCFENPDDAFLHAWNANEESLIEDQDGAATRMLLYRCYRAVVDIVTEYYRPRLESSKHELDARKRLTSVLSELDKADSEGFGSPKRLRRRSISGQETSITKRIKVGDGNDTRYA